MSEKKIVARLTAVGVTGNILLVAFKLYAGIAGHSGAMPGILRRRLIMLSIIAVLLTAAMIVSKLAA